MTESMTKVLCIAGLGRSGSTLLERTLDGMPGTVAVGELTHLWERGLRLDEKCGCGQPFSKCDFWSSVGKSAYGGWGNVDLQAVLGSLHRVERTRYVPRLLTSGSGGEFGASLDYLRVVLEKLYAAISLVSGCGVIIDSSKDPSYAYVLRRLSTIDLRVVHAIRDSPAVAYSWSKAVARPEADDSTMARWSPAKTAKWWLVQNTFADALRLTSTPVCRVRYEDFIRDPATELLRVAELVGIEPDERAVAMLREHRVELTMNHTVSGNPMRFTEGSVQIRLDQTWRSAMPARDRRLVSALTAVGRLRFGYLRREAEPDRVGASL